MSAIVLFTGGFDPVHSGHIQTLSDAKQYGRVVIGLNSDAWLTRKKGKPFMPFDERRAVLKEFKGVLDVIAFDDSDDSACDAISQVKAAFPSAKIIFVNGGDRTVSNIPEMAVFSNDPRVEFKFGVGGDYKKNSSSWILQNWATQSERRNWGESLTYYDGGSCKLKRLVLGPGQSISMQYHNLRSEFWLVEKGAGVLLGLENNSEIEIKRLNEFDFCFVPALKWHRLSNPNDTTLVVVEIQYGATCTEADIVRLNP